MIRELAPPAPHVIFATNVEVDDESYAVVTTLMNPYIRADERYQELQQDIAPQGDPNGFFQTCIYRMAEAEDSDEPGAMYIDPNDIIGVYRSTIGREALMNHDRLVEEVDQGEYDPTADPYYEYLQVKKLNKELDSFDINKLLEEENGEGN